MPLVMQYGKKIWKDQEFFHRGRAVGMLWEVGVARAMTIGPGALQLSDFVHVDLQGGNLQILEGGRGVMCVLFASACPQRTKHLSWQKSRRIS